MPIKKYRTIEEMNADDKMLWCDKPDDAYWRRLDNLWKRTKAIDPRKYPKGIFKFRTIEEMNEHREALLTEHVRALQARRKAQAAQSQTAEG